MTKRQLARCVAKWQRRLCMTDWSVTVEFSDDGHPEDADTAAVPATAIPSYRYLSLLVCIYPVFWTLSEEEQNHIIAHEMAHGITDHVDTLVRRRLAGKRVTKDEADDANEQICQWLANVVTRAYR